MGDSKSAVADKLDFRATYKQHVAQQIARAASPEAGLKYAIGAEFEAFGILEREVLIQYGLRPDGYVIDVGCGSGRLAKPLSHFLTGRYLGIDVVPDLLELARKLCNRPDWRFELAPGLTISERDAQADVICFFSVFTHLLHEQSYSYLQDAKRVLKPDGKIIFSFLEFAIPCHWDVFVANLAHIQHPTHLNQFMSRDGIRAWAEHLGLRVIDIQDGDKPHIPVPYPLRLDDGRIIEGKGNLGQSICVLAKA
jgi:SAM-dependent methyltransferase